MTDLRQRAEAFLGTDPEDTPTVATAEVKRLVHELQVHQIELEMQNEELREAQTALAHARDTYAELYDFAPVGYLTLDDKGVILAANHTAATLLEVDRGTLIRRAFTGFVARDAQDEWFRHRREVMATNQKQSTELRLHTANGAPFTARLESRPRPSAVEKDQRCLVALIDVTDRALAQEALAELNRDLERRVEERTASLHNALGELKETRASLTRSDREKLAILDAPTERMLLLDPSFTILWPNKAACDSAGLSREALTGRKCYSVWPQRTTPCVDCPVASAFKTGEPADFQTDSPGQRAWFIRGYPIKDERGAVVGAVEMARDTTQRRQIEQAQRQSEERFRSLFSAMSSGVAVYEAIDGGTDFVFTDLNHAGERISQVRREDVLGKRLLDLFPAAGEMGLLGVLQRVWRTGRPERLPRTQYRDQRIQTWVENSVFRLPSGEVVAVYDDRSGEMAAEAALHESEERYRRVFEADSDAILVFDAETRGLVDANSAALGLYGYSRDEFLSLTHLDISEGKEESDLLVEQALARKRGPLLVRWHRKKNGVHFPVECSQALFMLEGRRVLCAIVRDVSERVAAEQALEEYQEDLRRLSMEMSLAEERERRRIASELHDELGQLLATGRMRLDLCRQATQPAQVREHLEAAGAILDQAVEAARTMTFELSCPMLQELGLGPALEQLCTDMSRDTNVHVAFHGDRSPLELRDETRLVLYRCARELLINVMKHAEARYAEVTLERAGPCVRIQVGDDGKGFDASEAGMGFSPSGGFGLFNTREYVRHAGGELRIESIPGDGTRVTLEVPIHSTGGKPVG